MGVSRCGARAGSIGTSKSQGLTLRALHHQENSIMLYLIIFTHHSLCYLPGEGQHVLGRQRVVFIFVVILFVLILVDHRRLSAVSTYVNAAVSPRESNVNLANVISASLILLQQFRTKISHS